MLLGHSDTVFPRGTAAARPMTIEGDRIRGPGVCDMKAGLLTGIYALGALRHVGWDDDATISYVVVSDEEIAERHSVPLLMAEGPQHDAILTLEAARENGDLVTARKAVRWYTVEARGKSAHAGVEPAKGRSAVLGLAHLIVQAASLNDLARGLTVNPGEIRGGGSPSVVVDRASVRFDLRAWSTAELDELAGRLQALVATEWVPGVTMAMALEPGSDCPAMERTAGVAALEARAVEIARGLGFALRGAATGGGSDISFAAHRGTPGLDGLGPIGGLDHGPDEYILSSSIVLRTALLAKLIGAIADSGGILD
ncbi:MAG: M20/M25/M40 family metallo-hydrolase [Sphaerobacter sp.]|nr:M20/M25/M40 family metallo-hydrolase [Sphaerobacter sp.]